MAHAGHAGHAGHAAGLSGDSGGHGGHDSRVRVDRARAALGERLGEPDGRRVRRRAATFVCCRDVARVSGSAPTGLAALGRGKSHVSAGEERGSNAVLVLVRVRYDSDAIHHVVQHWCVCGDCFRRRRWTLHVLEPDTGIGDLRAHEG